MNKIVGIQLRKNGKIYDFDSGHFVLKKGTKVVVNTEQGQAVGIVCLEPRVPEEKAPVRPLKKVYRLANENDLEKFKKNCKYEKDTYDYCYEKIREKKLPMSLVAAERLFDGSKIIIYFSADERIDFRELVKDLVQKFHTRIEMKQIGVRHQAKMVGGLGTCGRELCCSSHLNSFKPVSIKMAKQQNLSLNPSKISGMCGRLMCCLTYEFDYYNKAKKGLPKVGKTVDTPHGKGKVLRQNLLRNKMTVLLESREEIEISCDEITKTKPDKKGQKKSGKKPNE